MPSSRIFRAGVHQRVVVSMLTRALLTDVGAAGQALSPSFRQAREPQLSSTGATTCHTAGRPTVSRTWSQPAVAASLDGVEESGRRCGEVGMADSAHRSRSSKVASHVVCDLACNGGSWRSPARCAWRTRGTRWTNGQLALPHGLRVHDRAHAAPPPVRLLGPGRPQPFSCRFAAALNASTGAFHVVNYLGLCGGALVFRARHGSRDNVAHGRCAVPPVGTGSRWSRCSWRCTSRSAGHWIFSNDRSGVRPVRLRRAALRPPPPPADPQTALRLAATENGNGHGPGSATRPTPRGR